jgi:SNF2 family DNA or RNA helicase
MAKIRVKSDLELRGYQKQILDELSLMSSIGLFMGTGTGKTFTSIFRTMDNPTDNLLIVCPHNVLGQWEVVMTENFDNIKIIEFKKSWSASRKNKELKKTKKYNVVIVNFEILHKMDNLVDIIDDSWTIIIDESHRIKDAETKKYKDGKSMTKTTKMALRLSEETPWKVILTATPTQGNYGGWIDFYPQLKFLGLIDMTLKEFKKKYCKIEKKTIWGLPYPIPTIVGYRNTEELGVLLKLSCRHYESKFGDFEPQHNKIIIDRPKSYNRLKKERSYEDIILSNSARKRVGLKTLTTGTVKGMDLYGEDYTYDDNDNKEKWLKDFLEDTSETVAIYYQYNVELDRLKKLMKKLKKKFIIVNGATKDPYKEINNKEYDVMLGQFQSASQSLDGLQHKCHIMVDFSMPESSLVHKQHIGRINRDGQTKVPMYYYLVMDKTIDADIYKMIEQKVEFSQETLDKLVIEGEENNG